MGSFNVACSISNLTIPSGDRVVFIPLLPADFRFEHLDKENRPHLVGVQSMLIYPNCYFDPFSLPIEGTYDDYGGVEKIKKDANTQAIEKFFGITIDKFINCVTISRSWHDYFSGIHEAYSTAPKLLSDHNIRFDENFLQKLDFEKSGDGWKLQNFPYIITVTPKIQKEHQGKKYWSDPGFVIKDLDNKIVHDAGEGDYRCKDKLYEVFHKLTGWYLGIAPENHKRLDIIRKMSGMFVLKDIYDALTQNNDTYSFGKDRSGNKASTALLTEQVLKEMGFEKDRVETSPSFKDRKAVYYKKKGHTAEVAFEQYGSTVIWKLGKGQKDDKVPDYHINKKTGERHKSVYSTEELGPSWEKATGEKLDLSRYEKVYTTDLRYDDYRKELIKRQKERTDPTTLTPELQELIAKLKKLNFGFEGFGGYFRDCRYFADLYEQPIIDGHLKEDFRWYILFLHSMASCNRFFFPAANGEQEGNDAESKVLLEASLKIVNERLKDYQKQCNDDNTEMDA